MTPCHLISQALRNQGVTLPELPSEPTDGICAVTGIEGPCLNRQDVLGKSFTNMNLLAAPNSQLVGVDVFYAWFYGYRMTAEKKRDKRPERMSSWFCDGLKFDELDRQGVREKVLHAEMPLTWTAYATTSYKKHGSLLARVNSGSQRFWLFEERLVDCSDMEKVIDWWGMLNAALRQGIGRSIMESMECPPYIVGKVGMTVWMDFELWARDKWQSSLYAFLCYLLPSQQELKDERLSRTNSAGEDTINASTVEEERTESDFGSLPLFSGMQ